MKRGLRRIRGMLGMGLTWAIAWAVIGGGIMEGIVDPHGRILDMWPQTLAIPGFLLGVLFALVLTATEGRRSFDELSVRRSALWGALSGVVLGGVALAAGIFPGVVPGVLRAAAVIGPLATLSAGSAAASVAIAKRAGQRTLPSGAGDGATLPSGQSRPRELPGQQD
jgi:hypothetical protein